MLELTRRAPTTHGATPRLAMSSTIRLFLAALLGASCMPLAAGARPQAPRLYITTENAPPASMREGSQVTGIDTDKVRAIMARTRVAHTIELLPWKRAYATALQRPDGCVFSTTRTPERERLFKWIGPIDEAEWVLMGRADRHFPLRSLEDARALRIGTYYGDARDQYLRARGFEVDPAPNDLLNPPKLLVNRIDLWAASRRPGSSVLAQHGWSRQIVPVLSFKRVRVFLACNRAVPDALVARMNGALEGMARDGTMRHIERKYESAPRLARARASAN
jgi:polar amino acid transport system substrate-binding protein